MAHRDKDYLICVSLTENIYIYDLIKGTFTQINQYESLIDDVIMIYPTGEFIVTLSQHRDVTLWISESGKFVRVNSFSGERLIEEFSFQVENLTHEDKALAIAAHRSYPYFAVSFESGKIRLISVFNRDLADMSFLHVCKHPLNSIYFGDMDHFFVTADLDQGIFYVLTVSN